MKQLLGILIFLFLHILVIPGAVSLFTFFIVPYWMTLMVWLLIVAIMLVMNKA